MENTEIQQQQQQQVNSKLFYIYIFLCINYIHTIEK